MNFYKKEGINMATSSFFHNFTIETEEGALRFLKAIEEAEKAGKKRKKVKVEYRDVKDEEEIRRMFGKKED